ncbi:unnamed protein product [Caenorhabditis brenneri]
MNGSTHCSTRDIYTTNPAGTMSELEELTNDLCYDHQIVFQPIGLPENKGPIYTDNEVDLERTKKEYGYGNKTLFNTRFNA